MYRCMGCMADLEQNTGACPHCGYVAGTQPAEAYHLTAGTILQGRYIAGRVLGYGGFGVTYIGWDAELERIVAIKEYLPSTFATRMPGDTEITVFDGAATEQYGYGLTRFVDEAQRLAQFNGIPGIVDIYDTFSSNKTAYIVMEFLQGRDVKQILAANGPLPYEQAREIVVKVCEALAPVHEKGIIHRDISPDNIYITTDGNVRLLDFGAARYESSVNSKSLSVILKSGYAPEEQYRSKGEQGSWTDVYALAATMYKMLTGVTPEDSMERAIKDELKEPSKLGVELPESAENALMNALNIRKNDRTQTVGEFSRALGADEVERVVVKQGRVDTGRIPTWGKVLLGGGAGLLLLFALLFSTGVVSVGEDGVRFLPGNLLSDDYGPAVGEGMVVVPNLLGMTEEEAEQELLAQGLEYEFGGYTSSNSALTGVVAALEPAMGAQVQQGGTVKVFVNIGSMEPGGNLDHLIGMDVLDVLGLCSNNTPKFSLRFTHVDSDAPAGSVVRYEFMNDRQIHFCISAGPMPEDQSRTANAEIRMPIIYSGDSRWAVDLELVYGNTVYEPYDSSRLLASADGVSWLELGELKWPVYGNGDFDDASYFSREDIYHLFTNPVLDPFEGEAISLQLEATLKEDAGTSQQTQTVVLPQTISVEYTEIGSTFIENVEILTWEEVAANYSSGVWDEENELVKSYLRETEEDPERLNVNLPLVITGDFSWEDDSDWDNMLSFSSYYNSGACYLKEGEDVLYLSLYVSNGGKQLLTLASYDSRVETSLDGRHLSIIGGRPGRIWLDVDNRTATWDDEA